MCRRTLYPYLHLTTVDMDQRLCPWLRSYAIIRALTLYNDENSFPQVKLSKAYKTDTGVPTRLCCKELRVLVYSSSVEQNSAKTIDILAYVLRHKIMQLSASWFILFGSQQAKPVLNVTVSPSNDCHCLS